MWLQICQGLMVLFWLTRLFVGVIRSTLGVKIEPTGALGVFINIVWSIVVGVITWRAGAISTIIGAP